MADVQNSPPATAATGTVVVAAAPSTVGSTIDAEIVVLKSRLAKLETAAQADWAKLVAGFKRNWAHYATWVGLGVTIAKLFGKL